MSEYYFTANIDNETTLCLAPMSSARVADSGQEIEDTSGYFLYETRRTNDLSEVTIIARVVSEDAALQLSRMLNME